MASTLLRAGYALPSPSMRGGSGGGGGGSGASSLGAATVAPPLFPPATPLLSSPDYTLPGCPSAGDISTPVLLRQVQHSGALARWVDDMQQQLDDDPASPSTRSEQKQEEAQDDLMMDGPTTADAPASLSAWEERLLSRLLSFVDSDPEVQSLLRAAEQTEGHHPPPSLHELVRAVNQRCQRTVLAPPQQHHHHQHHSRPYARASSSSQPHPSDAAQSILPELQSRCTRAFQRVAHGPVQPNDSVPPADWLPPPSSSSSSTSSSSRAARLLASTAESVIVNLQNEQIERSNRMHEAAATTRIVL